MLLRPDASFWADKSIYVAGMGAALGDPQPVPAAVAAGIYSERDAARTAQLSVAVARPHDSPLTLAVDAARQALSAANATPHDVGVLLHAAALHAGRADIWTSAAHVAGELRLSRGPLVADLGSGCAGGLVGLELAAALLLTQPAPAALITAADTWPDAWMDRWTTDATLPLGDGAAALVLARNGGVARLLAICTMTDTTLEGLGRGDLPTAPLPPRADCEINMRERFHAFLNRSALSPETLWQRKGLLVRAVLANLTKECGIEPTEFDHFVTPYTGRHVYERAWLPWLGADLDRTTWDLGRHVGHLGPADPFAALAALQQTQRVKPGHHVLMLADGLGEVFTAVALEWL